MNNKYQTWKEQEFLPWQQAMQNHNAEKEQTIANIRAHAAEVKYIVALIFDNKGKEAVTAWNELGLQPKITKLKFDQKTAMLTLKTEQGTMTLTIDEILDGLQRLIG